MYTVRYLQVMLGELSLAMPPAGPTATWAPMLLTVPTVLACTIPNLPSGWQSWGQRWGNSCSAKSQVPSRHEERGGLGGE